MLIEDEPIIPLEPIIDEDSPMVIDDELPMPIDEDSPMVMDDELPMSIDEESPMVMDDELPMSIDEEPPMVMEDELPMSIDEEPPMVMDDELPMSIDEESPMVMDDELPMSIDEDSPMSMLVLGSAWLLEPCDIPDIPVDDAPWAELDVDDPPSELPSSGVSLGWEHPVKTTTATAVDMWYLRMPPPVGLGPVVRPPLVGLT